MKYSMIYIVLAITFDSIQPCSAQQKKPIQGAWIDNEDKNSVVKFDRKKYYQIYKFDTVFSGKYFRSSTSCDSNYLNYNSIKNLDFICVDDGTCFEITGLTDSTLAYRHTISGKVHLFFRSPQQQRRRKNTKMISSAQAHSVPMRSGVRI